VRATCSQHAVQCYYFRSDSANLTPQKLYDPKIAFVITITEEIAKFGGKTAITLIQFKDFDSKKLTKKHS